MVTVFSGLSQKCIPPNPAAPWERNGIQFSFPTRGGKWILFYPSLHWSKRTNLTKKFSPTRTQTFLHSAGYGCYHTEAPPLLLTHAHLRGVQLSHAHVTLQNALLLEPERPINVDETLLKRCSHDRAFSAKYQ